MPNYNHTNSHIIQLLTHPLIIVAISRFIVVLPWYTGWCSEVSYFQCTHVLSNEMSSRGVQYWRDTWWISQPYFVHINLIFFVFPRANQIKSSRPRRAELSLYVTCLPTVVIPNKWIYHSVCLQYSIISGDWLILVIIISTIILVIIICKVRIILFYVLYELLLARS